MAENPFQIDRLNSINFDNDEIRQVNIVLSNVPPSYGGDGFVPGEVVSETVLPGKISVVNSEYQQGVVKAGIDGTDVYYWPTFGALEFEGVDGTFWIHGFSENGLLLSPVQNVFSGTGGGLMSTISGAEAIDAKMYVFGSYGIYQYQENGASNEVYVGVSIFGVDPTVFAIPAGPVDANDNITDYTGIVDDVFFGASAASAEPNGDGTSTVTASPTSGSYKVTGFEAGTGTNPDRLTIEVRDAGGTVTSTVTADVLGHNGSALVVALPDGPLVLTQDALTAGTDVTYSLTHSPAPFALPCFAEGVLIATPDGERAVETLVAGDHVLTASGNAHEVMWVGSSLVRPSRHPRAHEVQPVRVRAGAFGEGLPLRDLRLSPGHAVYVDGVLVPVGHLVNGATIVQEQVEQIRYFHVELDSHDVLLAEGLPCESYLDDGNRSSFGNSGEAIALHGRLDPKSWDDACAPLVADGPQLAAIRQMLHARTEALGWTRCEDADLLIEADGVTILPESIDGNAFRFTVPAAASVVLRSNAGVLGQVMPELADRRLLGVAVSGITVNGNVTDLDDALFGAGFHQVERQDAFAWRWSDGAGTLELGGEPATIEVSLAMVAPSWKRAAATLRIAA